MPKVGYEHEQKIEKFRKKELLEDNLVEKFFLFYSSRGGIPFESTAPPPEIKSHINTQKTNGSNRCILFTKLLV